MQSPELLLCFDNLPLQGIVLVLPEITVFELLLCLLLGGLQGIQLFLRRSDSIFQCPLLLGKTLTSKSGEKYKAWNCAVRQKGKKGNGCKCQIVKEDDLMEEILVQLGWTEFDEKRFQESVERVLVFDDRIEVEMKEAMSA